jgi:hypothetical protein
LSLETCRRLLDASCSELSDTQLARLRDEMYDLANSFVTLHEQDRAAQSERAALNLLAREDREAVEERAAVLEFDAGMTRSVATRTAFTSHLRTIKRTKPTSNL